MASTRRRRSGVPWGRNPRRRDPAVDFSLPTSASPDGGSGYRIGGAGVVPCSSQPEGSFKASGKTHVVDTGKMSAPSGPSSRFRLLRVHRREGESGRSIFERIVKAAGAGWKPQESTWSTGEGRRVRGEIRGRLAPPGDAAVPAARFPGPGEGASATRRSSGLGVEIEEW